MNNPNFYRFIIALCLVLPVVPVVAQTQVSPKYSVDADVNALASYGDTLIVAGKFSNVGIYTGGGALFTTGNDQPNLAFPKIIGTIYASTPDGAGGFYVYGKFRKESQPFSYFYDERIEHILPDFTYEAGFSLTVAALFRIRTLLYHNGILYIGGSYVTQINGQPAGDLSAVDVATKQLVNWIPAVAPLHASEINGLYIAQNTLYILGRFTTVGGQPRRNIAAINLYSGAVKPWNFSANFADAPGCNDIKAYKDKLIIGGNFGEPTFPGGHACAFVDSTTGGVLDYLFDTGGLFGNPNISTLYFAAGITTMALSGDTLFTFSNGTFDTRVTAIKLGTPNSPMSYLWAKYFNMIAKANKMETAGGALFVAGENFADIYKQDSTNNNPAAIERKIKCAVKLNTATGELMNWFPDPATANGGDLYTMSVTGNTIFLGGYFTHVNSLERPGIFMLKNSTQEVLPFKVDMASTEVNALKISGNTLYAAGNINYLNGSTQPRSVIAFNMNTGALLPWDPVNLGTAYAVEANNQSVFVGGSLTEPAGGAGRTNLFSIDRQTAALTSWAPNPNQPVTALHIAQDKLYVGGGFTNITGTVRNEIAAFDTATLSLTNWNPDFYFGQVNAIHSTDGTIWAGGNFWKVNGADCYLFAGLSAQSGALTHRPITSYQSTSVNAIAIKGCSVLLGGTFRLDGSQTCNKLAIYDMYNKTLVSYTGFCQTIEESNYVKALATTGNDLYFGGNFLKVNGKANAPNIERIQFPPGYFAGCGEYVTVQNGNWNDPSTWLSNTLPPGSASVLIRHHVTVTAPTDCFSIKVEPGGFVNVTSGTALKIVN